MSRKLLASLFAPVLFSSSACSGHDPSDTGPSSTTQGGSATSGDDDDSGDGSTGAASQSDDGGQDTAGDVSTDAGDDESSGEDTAEPQTSGSSGDGGGSTEAGGSDDTTTGEIIDCGIDAPCDEGQVCVWEVGGCGMGHTGCVDQPQACTFDYHPVCGCDGVTYGNACTAYAAGMSILHEGEC